MTRPPSLVALPVIRLALGTVTTKANRRRFSALAVALAGFALADGLSRSALADTLIPAISATGTGTFSGSPNLIIDGVLPPRETNYQDPQNVSWAGSAPQFTIDLGGVFTISSLIADLDNNDS